MITTCCPGWTPPVLRSAWRAANRRSERLGLLEGKVGWLPHQLALGHRGVLGKGPLAPAEDLITRLQLRHVAADRLDAAGVEAWNRVL